MGHAATAGEDWACKGNSLCACLNQVSAWVWKWQPLHISHGCMGTTPSAVGAAVWVP